MLAIAVILPTACLLWFMSEAVKNERLAMHQNLADSYHKPLEELAEAMDDFWRGALRGPGGPDSLIAKHPPGYVFQELIQSVDSALIYDPNGIMVYPTFSQSGINLRHCPRNLKRHESLSL